VTTGGRPSHRPGRSRGARPGRRSTAVRPSAGKRRGSSPPRGRLRTPALLQRSNDATTTWLAPARTALLLTGLSGSAFFLGRAPRPCSDGGHSGAQAVPYGFRT